MSMHDADTSVELIMDMRREKPFSRYETCDRHESCRHGRVSRTRTGTWLAKFYAYNVVFMQVSVSGNVCGYGVLSHTRRTGTWLAKIYAYDTVFVKVSVSGDVCRHHGVVLSRTRRTGACLAKIYACAAVLMQVSVSMRADKHHFEQPEAQLE